MILTLTFSPSLASRHLAYPTLLPGVVVVARARTRLAAHNNDRRELLVDLFATELEADRQWSPLYALAKRRGLLSGFGSVDPGLPRTFALVDVERELGMPLSALRARSPSGDGSLLSSQGALICQWLLLVAALYGVVRGGLELLGVRAHTAHGVALFALVTEHALLPSPVTRAATSFLNREYEARLASHEAGHLLVAYLLGIPLTGYQLLSPWGRPHTAFRFPELEAESRQGLVSDATLGRLGAVLMAGRAAEALDYGLAEGGCADELMLRARVGEARPEWTVEQGASLGWWSTHAALETLRSHREAHAALAAAMRAHRPLADCLAVISETLSPAGDPATALLVDGSALDEPSDDKFRTTTLAEWDSGPSTTAAESSRDDDL